MMYYEEEEWWVVRGEREGGRAMSRDAAVRGEREESASANVRLRDARRVGGVWWRVRSVLAAGACRQRGRQSLAWGGEVPAATFVRSLHSARLVCGW